MSGVSITIHRSADEIGGNCIEIGTAEGKRLILDAGRPLDAARDATGLLPRSLDREQPVEGVLISHAHQDHYGLLDEIPPAWPVFTGPAAGKLMQLTAAITRPLPRRDCHDWESGRPFHLGPFCVTPYLTDHSAFDAYMLQVDVAGKRLLYSGDFRCHGRKAVLPQRMMRTPPEDIDVLLMEGTNLGSDKPTRSEADLEKDFADLFRQTPGRVFVSWSAQNIDRVVTLYRACLKTGRTLAVDLYTAEVLELAANYGRIPKPGWKNLKVVITQGFSSLYKAKGKDRFVTRMARHGVSAAALSQEPKSWVIMTRQSLLKDWSHKGVSPTPEDAWCYSQWRGYLEQPDGAAQAAWFNAGGAKFAYIHTSGHASVADLKKFAAAMNPKMLVPVHGFAWDTEGSQFSKLLRMKDGETITL